MRAPLSRIGYSGLIFLLILTALGMRPLSARAQSEAEAFQDALLSRGEQASEAGPLDGALVQSDGFISTVDAGVSLADFSVSATFVNPPDAEAEPWDIGFAFRRSGTEVQQLVIDSLGIWYDSPYPAGTEESGFSESFDATPGASNTIDLVVEGTSALVGINGEFLAGFSVAGDGVAADVSVGTGFFVGSVVDGREIQYEDFEVWPLTNSSAQATAEPTGTPAPGGAASATGDTVEAEDAELFSSVLASQSSVDPLSGPYNAVLREVTGVVMVAWADVSLGGFHATATATVPAATDTTPWNIGFMFDTSPNGTLRIVVDSRNQVFFSVGAGGPTVIGSAPGLVTTPGGTNSVDLLVAGGQAWLGVNGDLVGRADVPADATASDIGFGSGFYSDQTLADRLLAFEGFAVLPLDPTALGASSAPTSTGLSADLIAEFDDLVSDTASSVPIAGPFSGRLVEATAGTVPLAPAGVALADFGASATFANPDDSSGALWDSGFRFRDDGTTNNRIVIDSLGDVYVLLAGESARKVAAAASYDPTAGGSNTLHLFVEGDRALFGVNGELVAVVTLPAAPAASDVQIGTGFFNEDFVVSRITDYRDFQVWELA